MLPIPTILTGGALGLLALTSLNSKIAGVLWGLGFIISGWIAYRRRPWRAPDLIDDAARIWVIAMAGTLACWVATAAIWGELIPIQSAEINAGARLLTGALAGWWITRVVLTRPDRRIADAITVAMVVACVMAAVLSLMLSDRDHYPSNAIAWAASIGLLAVLLVPYATDRRISSQIRMLSAAGACFALVAIFASQTRGAYPIAVWVLGLALFAAYRHGRSRLRVSVAAATGTAALLLVLAVGALHPADPLRLREAVTGLRQAYQDQQFNTASGARVYLFELGWHTFVESPWIGVGARNRRALIQQSGADDSPERAKALEHVRQLGHVHNAYLHHAMDGGLIGLLGFLLSLGGLGLLAHRLKPVAPIASLQVWGILFVHASTNLTSVNLAHNYYSLMLAISVAIVLIQARLRGDPAMARVGPDLTHSSRG